MKTNVDKNILIIFIKKDTTTGNPGIPNQLPKVKVKLSATGGICNLK